MHEMGLLKKLVILSVLVLIAAVAWNQLVDRVDIQEFYRGKRVILTGASRGIGKSMAIQLAQLGAKVVIAARSVDKLTQTQQECQQYTPHVHTVIADVSSESDCKQIVEKAVNEFGGVDILILNAAISPTPQWFSEMEDPGKKVSTTFGVNVLQSVYLVHHSLRYLNASRGIIVPISSGTGIVGMPQVTPYGTSKHALHGFFKNLNQEFIITNTPISITIMPLPFVLTEKAIDNWKPIGSLDGITSEDCADRVLRGIPLRRLWYYVDWSIMMVGRLYSLCPSLFDAYVRYHIRRTSHLFS